MTVFFLWFIMMHKDKSLFKCPVKYLRYDMPQIRNTKNVFTLLIISFILNKNIRSIKNNLTL